MRTELVKRVGRWVKHSSPTILTILGSLGVIATSVTTAKAAVKVNKELGEELESKPITEQVKLSWKFYIPAAAVGIGTITCIFGANVLNKRVQASIASAYALLNNSYKEYKKSAEVIFGEDATSKIKTETAKRVYISDSATNMCIYDPGVDDGDALLFYEYHSGRYFTSTMAGVIAATYNVNRNLELMGVVSLNDYYDFLGIEKVVGGDEVGWDMGDIQADGFVWLDFETNLIEIEENGLECLIVSATIDPELLEN